MRRINRSISLHTKRHRQEISNEQQQQKDCLFTSNYHDKPATAGARTNLVLLQADVTPKPIKYHANNLITTDDVYTRS